MDKKQWIEEHLATLNYIQNMDMIGGSMAYAEISSEFYEEFGTELLDELLKEKNDTVSN